MWLWEFIVRVFLHFRTHPSDLIATLALGITFWQGYISRQHNKLSVRPRIDTFVYNDRPVNSRLIFRSVFKNAGLGPAIIKKYEIIYNGQRYKVDTTEDVLKLARIEFGPRIVMDESGFLFIEKVVFLLLVKNVA